MNLLDTRGEPLDRTNVRSALLGENTPSYLINEMMKAINNYYDEEIPDEDDF